MKRLIKHIDVAGTLQVVSGLRIGAGGASLEIGGLDNPILRHPVTRLPYIPGSSLKGKLRSLLEVNQFKVGAYSAPLISDGPCKCGKCVACWLFGCGDPGKAAEPSRLIFRDAAITQESVVKLERLLSEGIFYSEVKYEVVMDRTRNSVAKDIGPRSMDRIAEGTDLHFRISIRVLDGDNEEHMRQALERALNMLESEGLGGSITRGYGQVRLENMTWAGAAWNFRSGGGSA